MAQGTSSYVSFSGSNGYNVRIYFDQTYNETTKVSTVSITKIGIQSTSYSGYSTYVDGIIKVNNVEVCKLWNNQGVTTLNKSTWYYITVSGSTTVTHGSDGSASISISVHANQFSNFYLRSTGGGSCHGGIASGQSRSSALTPVPVYTLTLSPGIGSTIAVSRTYSPAGVTGSLTNGAYLWNGDKLKIAYAPDTNYKILNGTVNGATFTSGNTHTVTSNVIVATLAQPLASAIAATDASIESSSTIVITRYDDSYTHTISYAFGELTGTIISNTALTTIAWTIPSTFYSQIPNSASGKCTLTCETYSDGTLLGSSKYEMTVVAAIDLCKPILDGTVVDVDQDTLVLTGDSSTLIRYKSDARCTITASSQNDASLNSTTINGQYVSSGSSYTYEDVSVGDFVFSAVDSRGYTTSLTVKPAIIPYVRLTINPVLERPSPTTGEIVMTFNGNYYNGSFGAYSNTLTIRYRYRKSSDVVFGDWSSIPPDMYAIGTSSYYTSSPVSLGTSYDYQQAYVFEIQAYDGAGGVTLDTADIIYPVQKGQPVFDWGEEDFSFHVPVNMDGETITGLKEPVGDSDAATKAYVDNVRDTVLGTLKEVLVWENSSPSSTFGATSITLSEAKDLNIVSWKIEYYFLPTNSATTIIQESRYDAVGHRVFAVNYTSIGVGVSFRQCFQNGTTFDFEAAKLNGEETSAMNPVRIWAICEV